MGRYRLPEQANQPSSGLGQRHYRGASEDRRLRGPCALTDLLADCLRNWHRETMYGRPTDWIFASTRSKGKKPRSSSVLTWDHLRPAAIAAGVKLKKGQRFGFHNFRHGLASWLVNQGTDVKTVQGLLRHSNVSTTLGLYAHRVNSSMMAAQDSVMRAITARIARPFNRVLGDLKERRQATFCRRELTGRPSLRDVSY